MLDRQKWDPVLCGGDDWLWQDGVLIHRLANRKTTTSLQGGSLISRIFVQHIYARQNRSRSVRDVIAQALKQLNDGSLAISFGSGHQRISPLVANLDVSCGPNVDIVSDGQSLPFQPESLDLVISQEVFEHLRQPGQVIEQIYSILKPGGLFVFQVPFIIGYHPDPGDYWRFTIDAFEVLFAADRWDIVTRKISVGHGTGLYRILVEFVAVNFSIFGGLAYRLSKGLSALIFAPIMIFDLITEWLPEKHRIPGGYILMLRKRVW